jgi:nucleotide-binding universal stress UspA family protein
MSFHTILVGVEGSSPALAAVDLAADLSRHYEAPLILLHVVAPRLSRDEREELAEFNRIEHLQMVEDGVLRVLGEGTVQAAASRAREKGANGVETIIEIGDPAVTIINVAKNRDADLIVIGRRGLSELAALLLGSVSHKVVQLAGRPCLVAG